MSGWAKAKAAEILERGLPVEHAEWWVGEGRRDRVGRAQTASGPGAICDIPDEDLVSGERRVRRGAVDVLCED